MKITIAAVGKLKEAYLRDGVAEFQKRIAPFAQLNIIEVNEEKIGEHPSEAERRQHLSKEGARLLERLPKDALPIALDVHGEIISSEELSRRMDDYALHGESHIAFIIGGAFGLGDNVRQKAKWRWSFSKLTFTHQMVRLLLTEQIYRAFKISRNEKYHW
ncbi:23S rRNA (pseudouridine(1915)-N(3))-methyltransferase RlmH [Selenomonas sp. TAMA-11512]|uniref:23S rRNA (pseudouridine(1915)-N(3))-methyltransferase RlmH n=1 Tax=Selenomonas sp. TAMA-11512 TaxID=3095337 RepID=UPI003093AEA1|nr:23S rRNA (pseudouridine(1915)-N(3))-methyltransferase RlmH [Selenomonas sp. TAMA-11512]